MQNANKFLLKSLSLVFVLSLLLGFNIPGNTQGKSVTFTILSNDSKLTVTLTGIDSLTNGFHYEGWAIVDGAPLTTGKFNVNAAGNLVDLNGNEITNGTFIVAEDLSAATAIVITIEPAGDTDTVPAATKYLGGDIANNSATLTPAHPAALGDDFLASTGKYILATPTDGAGSNENSGIWFLDPASNSLQITVSGLTPLANGFHYEGWAIVGGAPVTTGKFNVDSDGHIVDLEGNIMPYGEFFVEADITAATDIVITIEPAGDMDTVPAATKILGGGVTDSEASLSVSHPATLNDDFTGAMGNYILATPTDTLGTNENSGIWFLDLSSGSAVAGLTLPMLPAGWEYEGWAVIGGIPVTTGKFLDPAAADASAPFSGTEPGPPFPGEDFLQNAPAGLTFPTDLAGATAVITIEPSPDDSDAPFALKPLVGAIPSDATDHLTYTLGNNAGAFPTATAKINQPTRGLQFPILPAGWEYEGWVVIDGTPVTTGKFIHPGNADLAAPYSSTAPGPPFPGEDFLQNAPAGLTFPTDLAGATAVISIEPSPDDSPAPFTLKPLVGMIPAGAIDQVPYEMGNNAQNFPSGTANVQITTAVDDEPGIPDQFELHQNYPNPFNPETSISYTLANAGVVRIAIYNLLGQKIRTLVDAAQQAGTHRLVWDGRNDLGQDVTTGVYIYRMETTDFSAVKKMTLLR
jgi:hypothetical protein